MNFKLTTLLATVAVLAPAANAGPIAYGLCQTGTSCFPAVAYNILVLTVLFVFEGCNTVAVACYAAAGATFGTVVAAPAAPAVLIACNAALGTCSTMCATVALFAPTP